MATKSKTSFNLHKKPVFYILIVISVMIAGYFILFTEAATNVNTNAPNAPALYTNPRSQTLGKNETFVVDVRTNSGSTVVNAVQANIAYPASLVDLVSVDTSGSAYTVQAENITNPGLIQLGRGEISGVSGDQLVAKVTFKTKTADGSVAIDLTTGSRLLKSSDNSDLLSAGDLYDSTYQVDATGPSTSITTPSNNSTVEYGSSVNVVASASDSISSVTKVEFYIDNVLENTDSSSPYSYNWTTSGIADNTSHTIYAKAFDSAGNTTNSSAINVTVKDTTKPTVSISSPTANQTLEGTTNITASANDSGTGLSKVEFYSGINLLGTDTSSPYSYSWDTKAVSDGSYTITARAYDKASTPNVQTSQAVSVDVDNSDKVAPSKPGNFNASDITKDSIKLDWGASTDNVGVVSYELKNGSTVLQNTASRSFTHSGLQPTTTYNYTVVAVDAAGNKSPVASVSATTLTPVPGDTNGDQIVDIVDLSRFLSAWGTQNQYNADFNGDDIVDIADLSIMLSNWTI